MSQGLLQPVKFDLLSDCGTSQTLVPCVHTFVIAYLHSSFAKGAAMAKLLAGSQMPRTAAGLAQAQVARVAPARPALQVQKLQVAAAHPISGACQKPR